MPTCPKTGEEGPGCPLDPRNIAKAIGRAVDNFPSPSSLMGGRVADGTLLQESNMDKGACKSTYDKYMGCVKEFSGTSDMVDCESIAASYQKCMKEATGTGVVVQK